MSALAVGIESQAPLAAIIPSYLYAEYADDETLAAFVSSQNQLAQGYLDWFNSTPLAVYTSAAIGGALLDWLATGIYGIARPAIASGSTLTTGEMNSVALDTDAINAVTVESTATTTLVSDDYYKRTLTWILYRGDGRQFCTDWLKRRVTRFLNGPNGTDADVIDGRPSVSVAGKTFKVTAAASTAFTQLQALYASGALPVPFQYQLAFAS